MQFLPEKKHKLKQPQQKDVFYLRSLQNLVARHQAAATNTTNDKDEKILFLLIIPPCCPTKIRCFFPLFLLS